MPSAIEDLARICEAAKNAPPASDAHARFQRRVTPEVVLAIVGGYIDRDNQLSALRAALSYVPGRDVYVVDGDLARAIWGRIESE